MPSNIPEGYCQCGCGRITSVAKRALPHKGLEKDQHFKFVSGHSYRRRGVTGNPNPSGLCWCGCGQETPLATASKSKSHLVKGKPTRYIKGHLRAQRIRESLEAKEGPNPSGLCFCGCNSPTELAASSGPTQVKGKPLRYVQGHHARGPKTIAYLVQDCGYNTPCWIWQRHCNQSGYGQIKVDGLTQSAHRHYYQQRYGSIEKGLCLDHLCRVRRCVNPDHLEAVTLSENTRRGLGKIGSMQRANRIRHSHYVDKETIASLSRQYDVSWSCIQQVVKFRTWRG